MLQQKGTWEDSPIRILSNLGALSIITYLIPTQNLYHEGSFFLDGGEFFLIKFEGW